MTKHEMEVERIQALTDEERNAERPEPVYSDSRVSFGIVFFLTEEDADLYAAHQSAAGGARYNGGYCHGMSCGRDRGHDFEPSSGEFAGKTLYAVTTA